jgi:hypothetical protein
MSDPARVVPKHVQACQHSGNPFAQWFVWTWKRDAHGSAVRVPYSCGSWRCEVCRRHEASVTFARIKEAADGLDPSGWCFLVLTLDRNDYYGKNPQGEWLDVTDAYRSLGKMSEKLLKRLRRRYGIGNQWVAVVEAHRSGWPHVNFMLWCPQLARELESDRVARVDAGATPRESILIGGELLEHATATGWGTQSTAEAARSSEALAGYLVKLAGQHDASVGELAKVTQSPLNAPERFRRLRSGKGFLPPRHHDPTVTGCLLRRRRADTGEWEIERVNPPKDPAQVEPVERAIRAELALIDEEERILSQGRGMPAMPPLRFAYGGKLEGHRETSERNAAMRAREQSLCA